MTEIEAIGYMENEIRCIQRSNYCDRDCKNCNLVKDDEPLIESYGIAINALEKQKKIKEAFEKWKTETGGYYGADDETTRFISALSQILRSVEE